ncbi:MAG: aminotransferase class V-fold PLP-dependent enzyme [Planctomycetes bacterium]|nr:aminotransferase class V-fold PLP-dependent enzyme [Planctomycetota bacterium]
MRAHWALDPAITFLNHGSFGACPRAVLAAQDRWRARLEAEPVRFLLRDLWGLLDEARAGLAAFLHADPDDLAFVTNATAGVNAVLRSLALAPGDELLTTDHAYNACRNALEFVAERAGARVVVATVPFPLVAAEQVVEAVLGAVTPRTRLALIDAVTSPTGLVLPVARLLGALRARGVEILVDAAHAPGMLPLDLGAHAAAGAAYVTGNCHKWLCAPKGAGFLWVRRDLQERVRPLAISHGANIRPPGRSRFRCEFDWTGTHDPTPFLCVPEAIRTVGALVPGGWPEVMRRNRALALAARAALCARLGVPPPAPEDMIGSLAAVPLPAGSGGPRRAASAPAALSPAPTDPLQDALFERYGIEVPVIAFPAAAPRRWVRVSAQLYNEPAEYARLGAALVELLAQSS